LRNIEQVSDFAARSKRIRCGYNNAIKATHQRLEDRALRIRHDRQMIESSRRKAESFGQLLLTELANSGHHFVRKTFN